jgi:hypothetical protein
VQRLRSEERRLRKPCDLAQATMSWPLNTTVDGERHRARVTEEAILRLDA